MGSGLAAYVTKRALSAIPTLVVILILSFLLVRLAPGDPAALIAGEGATPEYIENIRKEYGLDKPLHEQFLIYLSHIVRGDWGYSLSYSRPVMDVLIERIPTTLLLVGTGILVALLLGVVLGVLAAVKRNTAIDRCISAVALMLYSLPAFVVAQFLIYVFALKARMFPISGIVSIGATHAGTLDYIKDVLWHLVLPATTLSLLLMAVYMRVTRASMIESLVSNYIIAARARGLRSSSIIFRHALKNALLPVVTIAGIQFGTMIGGVVITETIFSWPGVGRLTIEAVQSRDYPLLMGIFLLSAISVVIANLITDIIYTIIDPRVKLR
uniref:ABC transporter permease n=1 Tax=Fervidicoccus fontis TaxID=683846 RepID=A0A7J3ZJG4_9CREN